MTYQNKQKKSWTHENLTTHQPRCRTKRKIRKTQHLECTGNVQVSITGKRLIGRKRVVLKLIGLINRAMNTSGSYHALNCLGN